MVDDRSDVAPPADWRYREDGPELVARAFIRAVDKGSHEDLLGYVDIAAEFADHGSVSVANQMSRVLISRIAAQRGRSKVEVLALIDSSGSAVASQFIDRLGDSQTLLEVRIHGLLAHLDRAQNRNQDALRRYKVAAEAADSLGFALDAAINYQSLGALCAEMGDYRQAERYNDQASSTYSAMEDWPRLVATRLNHVQLLTTQEKFAAAELMLRQVSDVVRLLRDGHYSASWKRCGLIIRIKQGDGHLVREDLLKLYQGRIRAGDLRLAETLARDLALLTEDLRGEKAAIPWWRKALNICQRLGDHQEQQILAHALAVALLRDDQFEEAIEALSTSLDAGIDGWHEEDTNRALADRGTAHLAFGLDLLARARRRTDGAKEVADEAWTHLGTAETELFSSIEYFHATRDVEWSLRTATNLRAVWMAANKLSYGAMVLSGWATQAEGWSGEYAAALYRLAASLNAEAGQDSEMASDQLRHAAEIDAQQGRLDANASRSDAHILAHSSLSLADRLSAFDRAIELARRDGDMALVGDILNDSALLAVEDLDWGVASERLGAAEIVSEQSSNRVLAAMVKANLGEISSRQSKHDSARRYFAEAASLAEQVGDLESAADSMASYANSLLSLDAESTELEVAVQQAETLAERSGSATAQARAGSSRASFAYVNGEFGEAFRAWDDASMLVEVEERHEYRRLALEALVGLGNYSKFNRAFERYFRAAQREGTQIALAGELWHVAGAWLGGGRIRLAAKVLAFSVLLAVDGYSSIPANRRVDDVESVRAADLIATTTALAPARIYLEWEELGPINLERLNRYFEGYIRGQIDSADAATVIDLVHTLGDDWQE